jgi:hypothetical protein
LDKRYSPTYQSRLCWWCGSKLATEGVRTVKDPLGHEHPVHRFTCSETARDEFRRVTAAPNEWPV